MAITVGQAEESEDEVMAAINTTPLVDVMLVLLIIFLITIPAIIQQIPVNLPKERNVPTQTKPENITIAIDKEGVAYWNDKRLASREDLLAQVKAAAVRKPQPEIHIRGDKDTRYEAIGRVMYMIQRGGVQKVGFLTEPDHGVRGYR
jgi:biopolymer transport protein ExbD